MGLFDRLFKKKTNDTKTASTSAQNAVDKTIQTGESTNTSENFVPKSNESSAKREEVLSMCEKPATQIEEVAPMKEDTAAKVDVVAAEVNSDVVTLSEEGRNLLECHLFISGLLNSNKYIAKSDYRLQCQQFAEVISYFSVLKKSSMLPAYCKQNGLDLAIVEQTLNQYDTLPELVDNHNDCFMTKTLESEKVYLDNILHEVDPQIILDEDQRKVVLCDEDYCLVIAGAGAGKTTTVAAKVKYLVEKKNVRPDQILVVSFTNKAVQELQGKINDDLKIACPISTFHSVGNAIIHKNSPDEKVTIVDGSKLYFVLLDYFRNSILRNESTVNKLILFFASYFDAPFEGDDLNAFFNNIAKSNFSTMRSEIEDFKREIIDARTKKTITIQNEFLRSQQEVEIANFLYLNGIDYEYEPLYPYHIAGARKPYTPDFVIRQGDKIAYIEHFGISEDGKNSMFSPSQIELYKKAVNDKILLHRKHNTTLLYTFSSYKDRRSITIHLAEQLEKAGFVMNPKSNKEIMEKLIAGEENRYIRRLLNLISRFISNFKVNGYTEEDFSRMYHSTQNVRTRLFIEICNDCYLEYERYLKENNAIDFQDMINNSTRLLLEVKELGEKLDFKYVIVDEYQDISHQRFDLTKALSDVTDAKIIAVGDDWQSIYAFSGSDITLFTRFTESVGYAKMLKIVKTYRNAQEVIDIAGNFIQKNSEQIKKTLQSPKTIKNPVIIYTYDANYKLPNANRRTGANYALSHAVMTAIEQIITYNKEEKKDKDVGTILLLGRYGFDGAALEKSGLFEYYNRGSKLRCVKYPELKITFMTTHASKGLGYDNVIVLNGRNETYGFPSKIEDDPVLAFVIKEDRSVDYAEERRLFYVAMTRTKNRVYFVAPEQNPSEFLLEIKRDYKNVVLSGNWNEEEPQNIARKSCPICGYPLQLKYKNAYGLKLYICTNEPELCSFMSNDLKAEKMSIMKCDKCRDGYLVVKQGKGTGCFLGCTNYLQNQCGCNNALSKAQYYELMGYEMKKEDLFSANVTSRSNNNYSRRADSPYALFTESKDQKPVDQKQAEAKVQTSHKTSDSVASGEDFFSQQDIVIRQKPIKQVMYKEFDLFEVTATMLSALHNVSRVHFYGSSIFFNVLEGTINKKVTEAGLDKVPEFGSLSSMSRADLVIILEWMMEKHYMYKAKGRYPTLHETKEGLYYQDTITAVSLQALKRRLEETTVLPYEEI